MMCKRTDCLLLSELDRAVERQLLADCRQSIRSVAPMVAACLRYKVHIWRKQDRTI